MALQGYKVKDYATGELASGITSGATSINLKSGDGSDFPSYSGDDESIASLIAKDEDGNVTKRERIKITGRSSDTLTVERGYGGDSSLTFDADDTVNIFWHAGVITDIQEAIKSLESDKLDASAFNALREGLSADRVLVTDDEGNETYISIPGNSALFLNGDGEFSSPSVNIKGLTAEESVQRSADYLMIYDNSDDSIKKVAIENIADSASTSKEGLVEKATDAEASEGTDEDRYITPKQLKDNAVANFGDRTSVSQFTTYQAPTSGVLVGWMRPDTNGSTGGITIKSDSNSTPTTTIYDCDENFADWAGIPIKKGDYYKVDVGDPSDVETFNCYFHPIS